MIALYAARCPTISVDVIEKRGDVKINWRHRFEPRAKLPPYRATPAKAERLEAKMAAAKAAVAASGEKGRTGT